MAGNPYTESGDKFQIPDMLANRADIYNLGDISGTQTDLFELSLIENAITSNPYLTRLTQPAYQNLYQLYDAIQNQTPDPTIEGNFTAQEIADFRAVFGENHTNKAGRTASQFPVHTIRRYGRRLQNRARI